MSVQCDVALHKPMTRDNSTQAEENSRPASCVEAGVQVQLAAAESYHEGGVIPFLATRPECSNE